MSATATSDTDRLDDHVDTEIIGCLNLTAPRSFFLFAGAGSGKTRSLVSALDHVRANLGRELRLYNRRVAVITYTKAARDEIIRRTKFDPIIAVSTIHAFAWSVIEGFNHDIREWLRGTLSADIQELKAKEAKGRKGTKASADRLADIETKTRRLGQLDIVRRFVYSPDTDNRGRDSLNHSEVLEIAGSFIGHKTVMQQILGDGYPFILVDESQDTNRHIVDALFALQAAHPILEHRMAARRLGFDDLFAAISGFAPFRTGLLDGTLPILAFFSGRISPLVDAGQDLFAATRIVRAASPLMSIESLRKAEDEGGHLNNVLAAVSALQAVAAPATATFGDLLQEVMRTDLFNAPDALRSADEAASVVVTEDDDPDDQRSARDECIERFLAVPFAQIRPYIEYVTNKASFDTHQGVKGLEFPRVLVIMDDTEARGFQFKYEKLFGGSIEEDATTAATRRLFYVTCSRAERSLCLIAYTDDPGRVRAHVIGQGWFDQAEVEMTV